MPPCASGGSGSAALALLLFTLLRITGTSTGEAAYSARYDNVTGLAFGAPVFYEGFRVGHVNGITPERKGGRTPEEAGMHLKRVPKGPRAHLFERFEEILREAVAQVHQAAHLSAGGEPAALGQARGEAAVFAQDAAAERTGYVEPVAGAGALAGEHARARGPRHPDARQRDRRTPPRLPPRVRRPATPALRSRFATSTARSRPPPSCACRCTSSKLAVHACAS